MLHTGHTSGMKHFGCTTLVPHMQRQTFIGIFFVKYSKGSPHEKHLGSISGSAILGRTFLSGTTLSTISINFGGPPCSAIQRAPHFDWNASTYSILPPLVYLEHRAMRAPRQQFLPMIEILLRTILREVKHATHSTLHIHHLMILLLFL